MPPSCSSDEESSFADVAAGAAERAEGEGRGEGGTRANAPASPPAPPPRAAAEPADAESLASSNDGSLELFTAMLPLHQDAENARASIDEIRKAKSAFNKVLRHRCEALAKRSAILRIKYSRYKKLNDYVQIAIIVVSSWLTLLESIKIHTTDAASRSPEVSATFSLLPLFLSTSVTVSLSILKFKRLTELMESMSKTALRSSQIYSLLKRVEESLLAAMSAEDVVAIFESYITQVFDEYNSCQSDIAQCLTLRDYSRHSEEYHALVLQLRADEEAFTQRCTEIAEGQLPDAPPENAAVQIVRAPMRLVCG